MKNDAYKNLTVLVSTCDKYEDLWYPFFKLYDKFAGGLKSADIVLNTESKKYSYPGLNIICPNDMDNTIEWGRRLKSVLKTIKTDYVLFLLDDFFLQKPINEEEIQRCLTYLDNDKKAGAFNFVSIEPAKKESKRYKGYCYMPVGMKYRINAQACIWRKDVLDASILDVESPWEWEIFGNMRNEILLKDVDLYAVKYGVEAPYYCNFIDYKNSNKAQIVVHSAVMRGKWDTSCIGTTFEDNGIEMDYSIRGYYVTPPLRKMTFIRRIRHAVAVTLRKIFRIKPKYTQSQLEKIEKLVNEPLREMRGKAD